MPELPVLLTCEQTAELLDETPAAVYQLVYMRRIPHIKIGASLRFDKHDLVDWAAAGGREAYKRHFESGRALLDCKQVAELLDETSAAVYQLVYMRRIPSMKIQGSRRFDKQEVTAWIDAGRPAHQAESRL